MRSPTIFIEVSQELLELEQEIDELAGEEQEAAIAKWFKTLENTDMNQFIIKMDNYSALIQELKFRAEVRKEEAARLSTRAKVDTEKGKALRKHLITFLKEGDLKSFDTPRFNLKVCENGGYTPVKINEELDINSVPDRFITKEVNKNAVREALENGEILTFAKLEERGQNLRIK